MRHKKVKTVLIDGKHYKKLKPGQLIRKTDVFQRWTYGGNI
jgi:hypothetical protein